MQQHRDLGRFDGRVTAASSFGYPRPRRIELVCNPADDDRFAAVAESLLATGVASPARLQRLLQDRYPRVVVRARELSSEEFDVWYVYREGTWIRSGGGDGTDHR